MNEAKNVKLVILDVDGVMSDGRIVIDDNGVEQRNFDIKDGFGVVALQMTGIECAIITSKKSGAVRHRAQELKISRFYEGIKKKTEPYEEILKDKGIEDSEVCYVGDDLVDLKMMKRVGFPVAVADAVDEVREAAAYTTRARGGYGAVREVAELILKTQGKWEKILEKIG
jgi:3-deoxy-D-manno-octulosonate 8-phosphate phosphatase (KDO 8-P phosphatase)